MKYRKLRIAWSVAWGMVAVLLCVLWVRSQWRVDVIGGPITADWSVGFLSYPGASGLGFEKRSLIPTWTMANDTTVRWLLLNGDLYSSPLWGGVIWRNGSYVAPDWFLISIAFCLAALPWIRWRFSLRTLLIATTLVAVGLGVIVWLV